MGARRARARRPGPGLLIPIAFKFAVFIAVLVVAAMLWQASTAIRIAGEHLEDEITADGLARAASLASLIEPSWLASDAHQSELRELLERYAAGAAGRGERLQDIVVFSGPLGGAILATARGDTDARGQRRTESVRSIASAAASRAGVIVAEFEVDGVPVRSFSKEITARQEMPGIARGARLGRIEVLLSAAAITESREELSDSLRNVTLAACAAAAAAAFFLASILTRPIRVLAKDLRQVSLGDLHHKSRVRSRDELGALARTFNSMTESLQAAQMARIAQQALEHELSLATRIQSRLLPDQVPSVDGIDLAAFYLSAKEVGGDYYDFIPIDDSHLGIVVGDVSGKGVPGSLVMSMTRSLLRMAAHGDTSPARTLHRVNRCLSADIDPGMFVTLAYVVLHKSSREVLLARAGHNAPLLYSARREKIIRLHSKGIAIGLDREGALFEAQLEVQRFQLHPQDVLLLYTDGVVEAKSRRGEELGEERLESLLLENHGLSAREVVDRIVGALSHHQRDTERSDDITVLALKAC